MADQDNAVTDFENRMSYGDYLHLNKVLSAQSVRTTAPDELLFIIQHQTSELWMKLMLHELEAARLAIADGDLPPAFKSLARVSRIMEQLNNAWDVLRTMTPSDYTRFRDELGASSGFQSLQYRLIEFVLGNRNIAMMAPHRHEPDKLTLLEEELTKPSIYQTVLAHLASQGMPVPSELTVKPSQAPHQSDDRIQSVWETVYRDTRAHWSLYELAEKLVDLEDYFRRWRFNHLTTVERVIGFKRGTGGTGGVSYLKKMLETELFPELWSVRTQL